MAAAKVPCMAGRAPPKSIDATPWASLPSRLNEALENESPDPCQAELALDRRRAEDRAVAERRAQPRHHLAQRWRAHRGVALEIGAVEAERLAVEGDAQRRRGDGEADRRSLAGEKVERAGDRAVELDRLAPPLQLAVAAGGRCGARPGEVEVDRVNLLVALAGRLVIDDGAVGDLQPAEGEIGDRRPAVRRRCAAIGQLTRPSPSVIRWTRGRTSSKASKFHPPGQERQQARGGSSPRPPPGRDRRPCPWGWRWSADRW